MVPCQDTPAVKMPYTASITLPANLTALMSAVGTSSCAGSVEGTKIFNFEQKVPIPSYLIALAAGKLVSRDIGPRSRVWSEESMVLFSMNIILGCGNTNLMVISTKCR
jgi:leukotriene-A4 hydrolase